MIRRLMKAPWGRRQIETGPPSARQGHALYAIGDIHGRADLLEPVLRVVRDEAVRHGEVTLVCLGDYVDRGPDSRRVVETLLDLAGQDGLQTRFLRGNHDQILLDFLADHTVGPYWCQLGGRETLFSYGVEPPATRKHMDPWRACQAEFAERLPARHLDFFRNLALTFAWGDYFFVHAGVRPGVPLEQQDEQDLLWIRGPFLEDEGRLEKTVVHGHTPALDVHADHRRLGLDTGAYVTGVLSACRIEGGDRRVVQAVDTPGDAPELRWRAL
jgi:serine/threonine protein phosphatase 1